MAPKHPWWRHATIYQIYVRSWRDSNGDGVGDLVGLIDGLDYLQWLGVDAIWLSPTMPSPNTDYGYDVSDYFDVHPELGALSDMDRLIEEAGARSIAVMLDLVPNHTSDAHPWFVDALSGVDSRHRDYYVWAPPKPDGSPPNNWLDATGAPAWSLDEASGEYYLHNFLPTQPDLNWWDKGVHAQFERVLQFWFDRGVAGFRIDVAHGLYKDALLRDDPSPGPDDHPVVRRRPLRPEYSSRRPEVHDLYVHWRRLADAYQPERVLLGETWEFDYGRFAAYYGTAEQPELHLGFNFPFALCNLAARELAEVVEGTLQALRPGAVPVWTASNHDIGRFPTRWCRDDDRATRAALSVLATLPGSLVLYYGDELGMADVDVPPAERRDLMSIARPEEPGRDRCRTPLPWSQEPNAGFCPPGAKPWLPLGPYRDRNVQSAQADPGSVLNFWRRLGHLRQERRLGDAASLTRLALDDRAWAYRVGSTATVANISDQPCTVVVPGLAGARVLVSTHARTEESLAGDEVALQPWQALVVALEQA